MTQADAQKARQEIDHEIAEALRTTPFPLDDIHPDFKETLLKALLHETPNSLNCTWGLFKSLTEPTNLSLQEMGIAINAITNKTAAQLGDPCIINHTKTINFAYAMAEVWNAIAAPLKAGIVRKHETRLRISGGLSVGKTHKIASH